MSIVAYLIEQKCHKQIRLMFMCYVLCFANADLFLWRNKKISVGVLAGATAIWLLFEVLEYHLLMLRGYNSTCVDAKIRKPFCSVSEIFAS